MDFKILLSVQNGILKDESESQYSDSSWIRYLWAGFSCCWLEKYVLLYRAIRFPLCEPLLEIIISFNPISWNKPSVNNRYFGRKLISYSRIDLIWLLNRRLSVAPVLNINNYFHLVTVRGLFIIRLSILKNAIRSFSVDPKRRGKNDAACTATKKLIYFIWMLQIAKTAGCSRWKLFGLYV